ncbi:ORF1 [Camellia totivirus A]|nr:ORF1 [Camellia totivirus A]
MAAAGNLLIPVETDEQLQQRLLTSLEPLRGSLPDLTPFTVQSVLDINLTVDHYIKAMKPLVSFAQQGIFESIVASAGTAQIINNVMRPRTRDLYAIASWVKTEHGQNAITKIITTRKLQKSAKGMRTAPEMAWVSLFTSQQADYAQERKRKLQRFERKRAELKRQLAQVDADQEASLGRLAARYPVQAQYQSIPVEDLVNRSWEAYLADCNVRNAPALPKNNQNLTMAVDRFGPLVRDAVIGEYCVLENVKAQLRKYAEEKILHLETVNENHLPVDFVTSLQQQLVRRLLSLPLTTRSHHLELIPLGTPSPRGEKTNCIRLLEGLLDSSLQQKAQQGIRLKPEIVIQAELSHNPALILSSNERVSVLRSVQPEARKLIPRARSRWEAGVRKIIGGGELANWNEANAMHRGGGHLFDALRLFASCDCNENYVKLFGSFSTSLARDILRLPCNLKVPDGKSCSIMKNFNEDASAGPMFRAFGIKGKAGLKREIEDFVWDIYDRIGSGEDMSIMPYFLARVGYRSKLVTSAKAMKKIANNEPIGRAVMMLDAYEQAFSTPIYNVISSVVADLHKDPESGWRNYLIRASSEWGKMFEEIKDAKTIVELDWSKFDRERPEDHILFFIDVIISCFKAENVREERLLSAYKQAMRRALVHRILVTDDGGIFSVDGMIPSGSLWTGVIGTGLNILYIHQALADIGLAYPDFIPKCAGDDNLTVFKERYSVERMELFRLALNRMFRANIDKEDFIVHYPPYHVTKVQAVFPPGTDLSRGTSKMLDKCDWVPFTGEPYINEGAGYSHRWEYRFKGKPKFLANYWLPDGRCIRPAADSLERILWPEGIHKTIEDYEMAVLAMVVDNPWNMHNVNHLMHRYCIIQQIKRQVPLGMKAEDVMWYSKLRGEGGEPIPYPMIAYWRRQERKVHMERVPELSRYISDFKVFAAEVSTLYGRSSEGGMDAWMFMDILRGERDLGSGQFGNDIIEWCRFLNRNPLTKSLRAAKRFREVPSPAEPSTEQLQKWRRLSSTLSMKIQAREFQSPFELAMWVSDLYHSSRK